MPGTETRRWPWLVVLVMALGGAALLHCRYAHPGLGALVDGRAEGPWTFQYPGGARLAEGPYHQGTMAGAWTYWFENGQQALAGSYAQGARTGEWRSWLPDGSQDGLAVFRDGKEISRRDLQPRPADAGGQAHLDAAVLAGALPLRSLAGQVLAFALVRHHAAWKGLNTLMEELRALPSAGGSNAAEDLVATWPLPLAQAFGDIAAEVLHNASCLFGCPFKLCPDLPAEPGFGPLCSDLVQQILGDPKLSRENAHAVTRGLARRQHPRTPDPEDLPGIGIQDAFSDAIEAHGLAGLSEGVKKEAAEVMDSPQLNGSAEEDRMHYRKLLREAGY